MNSAAALHHCHVGTDQYKHHSPSVHRLLVSQSDKYKLIYRNIPKSFSSTSRHAMQHVFNGTDTRVKLHDMHRYVRNDRYQLFSFLRDPLSRFYSSYDEAYYRRGPWFGSGQLVRNARDTSRTGTRSIRIRTYTRGWWSTIIIRINSANLRMIGIVNRRKVSMTAI